MHLIPISSPGAARIAVHLQHGRCSHPPPASVDRLCIPRQMPASVDISRLCALSLFRPRTALRSLSAPGRVRLLQFPPYLCAPAWSSWFIRCLRESSGVWFSCPVDFREKARGQGASTPWHSLALAFAPPATYPFWRRSGFLYTPSPHPPYPLSLTPFFCIDTIPVSIKCWE